MPYLADTNVLLRALQRGDPDHALVRASLRTLWGRGEQVCYTPQNLVEFWRSCTRPVSVNGFGLSIAETNRRARVIERLLVLLPDRPEIHLEWRRLVLACEVSGVQVHDARLAAAMRVHGLSHILTSNDADFSRYPGIVAVHPRELIQQRAK
jgi:predicted nucleic acid-binding protein